MRVSFPFLLRSAVALPLVGIAAACAVPAPQRAYSFPPAPPPWAAPPPPMASINGVAPPVSAPIPIAPSPQAPSPSPSGPFDPPPLTPLPPTPPPPLPNRPADKVPSPEEQARKIADCARHTTCQDCVEAHKCGYCPDTDTCTPGDLFGPYPGTCSGAWEPMACKLGPRDAVKNDPMTRAALAKQVEGFNPNGPPVDHPLKDVKTPVTFQVHRGRCYQVTLRLSGDVDERWDLKPTVIPHVVFYEGGQPRHLGFDGMALDTMCPQEDGTIDVYLATDRAKKGAWRAQLWSAPITEGELARQRDRYETTERRAHVSRWCKSCVVEWARCRVAGEPRCAASYFQCLAAGRLTPADCERGDTAPAPKPKGPFNEARLETPSAL